MQGKSPKQIKNSYQFAGIGMFGACAIVLILMFSQLPKSPTPSEGIPHNYWVPTEKDIMALDSLHVIVKETNTDLDTVRQSLDRCLDKLDELHDAREWHGREGESEYGEYEYNKWMEKQ